MRLRTFSARNFQEMLRDRLNLVFGIGFPLLILVLLSVIQSHVPVELFKLSKLAPGAAVFGLSFLSLFSGMLIAKDRSTALLLRLFSSPMRASDFILGYTLPMLPLAVLQSLICLLVSLSLGLPWTPRIFLVLLVSLPADILYIGIGLLVGSLLNDRQVGGLCGALLTNVTAWLSGIWFDLSLLGNTFEKITRALPFANAVDASRAVLAGDYAAIGKPIAIVSIYAVVIFGLAVTVFHNNMSKGQ